MNTILFGPYMTNALVATALWKLYQAGESTVQAVRGVDLTIQSGEMVAVMGAVWMRENHATEHPFRN